MITNLSQRLMHLYQHYKNGLLPRSGGTEDQPAKYVQAMEIIDAKYLPKHKER